MITPPLGLRERKRAKTHALIQTEAMRLFFQRGFDPTTLDDIAEAAEVSRRTLFHYFESKEEIVFSHKPDFPKLVAEAVGRRQASEPVLEMAENTLIDIAANYESPKARNLSRLISETPSLNAGEQAKYEKLERSLAKALANRKNLDDVDIACRVTASAAIGILKLSLKAWQTDMNSSLEAQLKIAFKALRNIISQPSSQ